MASNSLTKMISELYYLLYMPIMLLFYIPMVIIFSYLSLYNMRINIIQFIDYLNNIVVVDNNTTVSILIKNYNLKEYIYSFNSLLNFIYESFINKNYEITSIHVLLMTVLIMIILKKI